MGFGRSYVSSSAASPLSGQTIGDHLASVISRQPDAEALVSRHQGARLTYGELGREVERVARGLLGLGIEKGDRVGIWSPTRVEWTLLQFATARVGAILVNINPAYRAGEMAYAVNQSGLRLLVTAPAFKTSDYLARIDEVRTHLRRLERVVVLGKRRTGVPGDLLWDDMLAAGDNVKAEDVQRREALLDADDPINIQYTSGTTGNPKGATLTHQNILNNARSLARAVAPLHRLGPCVHSGAALSLLRDGRRQPWLRDIGGNYGVSGGVLRAAGDARGHCGGALYEHLRRAHDVHRPARAPAVCRIRPHLAADGDHGRRPLPD